MRKNLAKHAAKQLPLAKRVLALCFALIFVCSCLLPAFANGTGAELDTPDTEVVEEVSAEPETLDDDFVVDEEPAALDDDTPVSEEEPVALDDSYGISTQPIMDGGFGMDADTATQDEISQPIGGIETPISGGSTPVVVDAPVKEGATNVTTDKDGNIVYEYDVSDVDFGDDFTISRPDGDYALDQVDAAYSIPTNIYHFWLKKMSSYDLADIARDAKAADMTVEQYLAMYGTDKGCFHIMTAADGANLKDYQFTDPTPNDDPEGNSRTFAGWYYTDELGDEHKFVFDEFLYISEGTTVEVYAKWEEEEKEPTTVEVTGNATVDYGSSVNISVKVAGMPKDTESLSVVAMDDDAMESFYEFYSASLSDGSSAMMPLVGFNITPKDEYGVKVQPTEAVIVTIFDLTELGLENGENLKVLHQTANGVETLDAEYSNGTLSFKTKSFSNFVIAGEATPDIDDGGVAPMSIYAPDDTLLAGESMRLVSDHDGRSSEGQNSSGWNQSSTLWNTGAFIHGECSWSVAPDSEDLITISGDTTGSNPARTDYKNGNQGQYRSNLYSENVTVTAKKNASGTARIIHEFSYYSDGKKITKREIRTIRIVRQAQAGHWVYLYVQVRNGTQEMMSQLGLTANRDNWFTIGKVYVDNIGVPDANSYYSETNNYRTGSTQNTGNANTNGNNDWKALMEKNSDEKWVIQKRLTVERYTENHSIDLDDILWDFEDTNKGQIAGLVNSDGAMDYITSAAQRNSDEGNGKYHDTWHLDGCLDLSTYGMVTVKHWAKVGGTDVLVDTEFTFGKAGEIVYEKDYQRVSVEVNGEDYFYQSHDVESQKIEAGKNKIINIYYSKEVPKATVTIKKQVTGLLGDHTKPFNFKVEVLDTDLLPLKNHEQDSVNGYIVPGDIDLNDFNLKHNGSITLTNVPIGAIIRVTETAPGESYDVTATGYDTPIDGTNNAVYEYIVVANDSAETQSVGYVVAPNNEITVINDFTIDPDMGVLLDTLPYILILAVVVGGGVLLFLRKRKNDDDDE